MKRLFHNGVLIPAHEPKGFAIGHRGEHLALTPEQEEMALAFARQLVTDRARDPVFVRNFIEDFARALEIKDSARLEDFDFSEIGRAIGAERAKREGMTREERRELAKERRRTREANRERYGYAIVDGERVETNFAVEPPCLFIGRGRHPLRGRWKPKIECEDIQLNLSPDAPTPELPDGRSWGGRIWDPHALWIARWVDKLTGKRKYVWLAETAPSKQRRERGKFDLARRLGRHLGKVRRLIESGLTSEDPLERQVATAVYLIDLLKLRVGDEKDPDELDTRGVTTLKKSNMRMKGSSAIEFDFLGKGAVRFHRTAELPPAVVENLRSFRSGPPNERMFPALSSEQVNTFLGRAMGGLTSKVFRTHSATETVRETLKRFRVCRGSPEFKKLYVVRRANLEAAKILNHRRRPPKNWAGRVERRTARVGSLAGKLEAVEGKPRTKARRRQARGIRKRLREAKLKLKLTRKTRYWNLSTSLSSYIDPRVYADWAGGIALDWKKIYSRSLRRKFAWVPSGRT